MQDGDFKTAIYNLNKMLEIMFEAEPKNPNLYYNSAQLFTSISDKNKDILDISRQLIDKAIEYNPRNSNYLIEKAYLLLYSGQRRFRFI